MSWSKQIVQTQGCDTINVLSKYYSIQIVVGVEGDFDDSSISRRDEVKKWKFYVGNITHKSVMEYALLSTRIS